MNVKGYELSEQLFDNLSFWVLKHAPIDSIELQQYIVLSKLMSADWAKLIADRVFKEMKRKKLIRFCKDRMWRRI